MKTINQHIRDRLLGPAAYAMGKKPPHLGKIQELNWFPRAHFKAIDDGYHTQIKDIYE